MTEKLPLLGVQSEPRQIGEPISAFAQEVELALKNDGDAKLLIFPELHLFGDGQPDRQRTEALQDAAEPLDGPRVKELRELAGDLKVWLAPGSVCERGPQGELFNTEVMLSPAGELAASYRKIFPGGRSNRTTPATASSPSTSTGMDALVCLFATTRGFPRSVASLRGWVPT